MSASKMVENLMPAFDTSVTDEATEAIGESLEEEQEGLEEQTP